MRPRSVGAFSSEAPFGRVAVERLLARQAIGDALARFSRGVDRRDWELARSAYHPDAFDDHGNYKGGVDGLIADIARRHEAIAHSFHLLGQMLVEFVDDATAQVETYVIVVQSLSDDDEALQHAAARYVDRFTRRNGDWRIAHRVVVPEVMWPGRGVALPANWTVARRDGTDPVQLGAQT